MITINGKEFNGGSLDLISWLLEGDNSDRVDRAGSIKIIVPEPSVSVPEASDLDMDFLNSLDSINPE